MDNSDLETIFHADGSSTGEIEAWQLKNLLESNGITVIMVGDSVLPNLPFEIKVARDDAESARRFDRRSAERRARRRGSGRIGF